MFAYHFLELRVLFAIENLIKLNQTETPDYQQYLNCEAKKSRLPYIPRK